MKAPDGFVGVVMGDSGTTPSPADTSRDCAGSAASSDTALGTYTVSIPASCLTTEPFPAFKWSAGRMVPTAGTETASDFAPDDELAAGVTNAPVTGHRAIGSDGKVSNFGDAPKLGEPAPAAAIDIDAAPHDAGYRTVDEKGVVRAFGLEAFQPVLYGDVTDLKVNEKAVSIAGTPTGAGYWIFTNSGRVIAFGDARRTPATCRP